MKTFHEYVQLQELTGSKLGTQLVGRSSLNSITGEALAGAMQAFEIVLSKRSSSALQFLDRMSENIPEIQAILVQHRLDNFKDKDFAHDSKAGATRGRKFISRGLANISPEEMRNKSNSSGDYDVVAGNGSDSYHNPIG